jgi:hypothetical protein
MVSPSATASLKGTRLDNVCPHSGKLDEQTLSGCNVGVPRCDEWDEPAAPARFREANVSGFDSSGFLCVMSATPDVFIAATG